MDVNDAWKRTCKVLFGDEIGELQDFEKYLKKNNEPIFSKKSVISGKNVTIADEYFCPSASFIGNSEVPQFEKNSGNIRLDLNQIKDIDSILNAVSEKLVYSGNVLLGDYSGIENSHRCTDSHFVRDSHDIVQSKYIAYSTLLRICEYSFGCCFTAEGKFGIKSTQFYQSNRCFEAIMTMICSDCYYTANLEGCQNCIFCFNLKSKNHCIGNLELPKDKYNAIKAGLVEQIREQLRAKKDVIGIVELLSWGKVKQSIQEKNRPPHKTFYPTKPPQNEVERAFSETSAIIFGRRLSVPADYQDWLLEDIRKPLTYTSAKSASQLHITPLRAYVAFNNAAISMDEAWNLGKHSLSKEQLEKLSLSNAKDVLKEISFTTSELVRGVNASVEESVNYFDSAYCYGIAGCYMSKRCAYSFYIRECENSFGCELLLYSNFCFKCYHSVKLTRCFEVLDSKSSSDCYFCHNIENCHDSMFCFNIKNLRYAVGNVEIGRERYLQVKKRVLDEISKKVEANKKLDLSIYNVGCKARM